MAYVPNERSIKFTQYLLPDGRKEPQWIERDGEVLARARAIEAAGYVFESEVLRNGVVSLEILHGEDSEDSIAHELVENGPGVVAAIDRLIATAHATIESRKAEE